MAWDLDGSTQYFDCIMPAAIKAAAGGPMTLIAFVDLDAATDGAPICNMSGSSVFQVLETFGSLNYGTSAGTRNGPSLTTLTPSAVGTPYILIVSKNTGNVAPEYTVIPWVSGAPGTPVSGSITGGGATLGDGVAPGASGFIRAGQYGTSTAERINGRVIALAQYTVYKDATARALLDSWNDWLNTSGPGAGLAWAMEFTALTTRTDASGNGGDESARNGTTPYTLVADPANFFPSGGSAVSVADVPNGLRLRSGYETVSIGVSARDVPTPSSLRFRSGYETVSSGLAVADRPAGLRLRSPEGSGVSSGVQATDAPVGFRLRSAYETVTSGVAIPDAPAGLRLRSGYDITTQPITARDVPTPSSIRMRSGYETVSLGGSAVTAADTVPSGYRLRSVGGAAVLGIATTDLPTGWRLRSALETVSSGLTVADRPVGLRLRSGYESITIAEGNPTDRPTGFRWRTAPATVSGELILTPDVTIIAEVDVVRVTAAVRIVRVTAPVRRFRA